MASSLSPVCLGFMQAVANRRVVRVFDRIGDFGDELTEFVRAEHAQDAPHHIRIDAGERLRAIAEVYHDADGGEAHVVDAVGPVLAGCIQLLRQGVEFGFDGGSQAVFADSHNHRAGADRVFMHAGAQAMRAGGGGKFFVRAGVQEGEFDKGSLE